MSETAVPGVGVTVQIGVQLIHNGPAPVQAIDWFDNATIHDPSVQSAYFEVSGNATVPDGLFYESELVFGGEGNGESTQFTQLSASLGLFYGNSTAGAQTAYPSGYSFGGNTGEAADNLQVSYAGNGFSSISVGTPNYVYLGRESGSYTLPLPGTQSTSTTTSSQTGSTTSTTTSSVTFTTISSSTITTSSATTSSVTSTTTSSSNTSSATSSASSSTSVIASTTSSASSSSSGASSTSLPTSYLLLMAVQIGVILLFCSVAALRRIGKQT
jgi:thermopsin